MRNFFNAPALEAEQSFDFTHPYAFLGGTVDSTWRNKLIPKLTCGFFNPVVANWTPDDRKREDQAKAQASIEVYAITPKHTGFYAIAEMTKAVCGLPERKVALLFLEDDDGVTFDEHQAASITAIRELLSVYPNATAFDDIDQLASWLNTELANGDQGTA